MKILRKYWSVGVIASAVSLGAHAQGVLTLTPGRATATAVGTGTLGYADLGASATSATLATPSAMAYDSAGNLYFADTNNHAIRELVKDSGLLVTVAGTGIAGFSGDRDKATAAQLDTPPGLL